MFNPELFLELHGQMMTSNIPHTAQLAYEIHKMLLADLPGYVNSKSCKVTSRFLEHFEAAGGILKDS
jgi:hypothetical protein